MPKVFTPWSARRHRAKSQDTMFLIHHLASWDPSCQRALWVGQTRWQTSRRANLNTMARWSFVSLGGRYSRQPFNCFLRWQSSHRRRYSGRYGRKTEKYSTLSSAYRFEPITIKKSWHPQFHNSELYFPTRPPNLCSRRRCERDFILIPTHFYHATTLQLRDFARQPVDLPDLWPSDILILAFLVFNPGDLYYPLGYKFFLHTNNNNNNNNNTVHRSLACGAIIQIRLSDKLNRII